MIWTSDENSLRELDTMTNPIGKSCANCHWGDAQVKKKDRTDWVTCGHHIQNFRANSLCAYWTKLNDSKVKAYFDQRYKDLKKKRDDNKTKKNDR